MTPIPEKCPKCGAAKCATANGGPQLLDGIFVPLYECGTPWHDATKQTPLCLARQEIAALKAEVKDHAKWARDFYEENKADPFAGLLLGTLMENGRIKRERDSLRADLERVKGEREEAAAKAVDACAMMCRKFSEFWEKQPQPDAPIRAQVCGDNANTLIDAKAAIVAEVIAKE